MCCLSLELATAGCCLWVLAERVWHATRTASSWQAPPPPPCPLPILVGACRWHGRLAAAAVSFAVLQHLFGVRNLSSVYSQVALLLVHFKSSKGKGVVSRVYICSGGWGFPGYLGGVLG